MPAKKTASTKKTVSTAKTRDFSIGGLLSQAWEIFKDQWLVFYGVTIASWVVMFVLSSILEMMPEQPFFVIIGVLLNLGIQFVMSAVLVKAMLDIADRRRLDFSKVINNPRMILNLFAGSLLLGLIVIGGFILFIIPGIIWSIKYRFLPYLIVEKDMGPLEALRESGCLTDGHKWQIFAFGVVMFFVNLMGLLALFVGLLITAPVTSIAQVVLYRHFVPRK